MKSRIQVLERQIAYRRTLRNIENVQLWERYAANLALAEAELIRLTGPDGAEFYKNDVAALKARFGISESTCETGRDNPWGVTNLPDDPISSRLGNVQDRAAQSHTVTVVPRPTGLLRAGAGASTARMAALGASETSGVGATNDRLDADNGHSLQAAAKAVRGP